MTPVNRSRIISLGVTLTVVPDHPVMLGGVPPATMKLGNVSAEPMSCTLTVRNAMRSTTGRLRMGVRHVRVILAELPRLAVLTVMMKLASVPVNQMFKVRQ